MGLSSIFSDLGSLDRNVFFGESWGFCGDFEIRRSEGFEEVSRDLRPAAFVVRRANFAGGWLESAEYSERAARIAGVRRGSSNMKGTCGSFPFPSFMNTDSGAHDCKWGSELFRLIICCHGMWHKDRMKVATRLRMDRRRRTTSSGIEKRVRGWKRG
jgi:hypothetical protein